MMELSTAAQVALYIFLFFVAFLSVTTVGLLFGLVFALNKLNQKLDLVVNEVRPVIAKTTDVLDQVQRVTMNVGEKADVILAKGEVLTDSISTKVDHTASVVEKAVLTPLINISSVIAGVTRGLGTFNRGVNNGNGSQYNKTK